MHAHTDEQPPTVAERADDEIYANAVNALAATYRMDIDDAAVIRANNPGAQFAWVLDRVSRLMRDGWDAPDALATKALFERYGAEAVLLALRRAYTEPQPDAPLVGD